jgi:hypothetical protein
MQKDICIGLSTDMEGLSPHLRNARHQPRYNNIKLYQYFLDLKMIVTKFKVDDKLYSPEASQQMQPGEAVYLEIGMDPTCRVTR